MMTNIEAMESLKKSEANLKAIIENSLESIWSIDRNYCIRYVNEVFIKAFEENFGERLDIGVNILDALPESLRELWKERYDRAFNNEHFVFSDRIDLEEGDIYIEVAMNPILLDGEVIGASFYGKDVTEQKKYEIQLLAAKEKAEDFEERYNALYERSNDFVYIHDLEGNIIDANKATLSMFGYTREEVTGMNFRSLLDPADLPRAMKEIQSIIKEGTQKGKAEFRLTKKSGEAVYVETRSSLILNEGNVVAIQGIARDITERKLAEESIKKLNLAISQSQEIIFITDREGIITYLNPQFSNVYGYHAEEVLGKVTPRILKSGLFSQEENAHIWKMLLNKEKIKAEYKNRRKDGSLIDIEGSADPILDDDGEIIGFLGIHRDISDRKRFEEDLIKTKEKAEESDRLKTAFLANMSHEIRTPMNGILGFLSLLGKPDLSDDTRDRYISIVNSSGERLLNTINDIIEISKIESGDVHMAISPIDILKLATFYYDFFLPETEDKGISLHFFPDTNFSSQWIHADRNKLDSIITNLLKNAIKFTRSGSIEFGYLIKGSEMEFFVKDTGIGIRKENLDLVFDRFMQLDQGRTRIQEGSGVGLSICKAYVEMMGGRISVESEENTGTTFYFTIPLLVEEGKRMDEDRKNTLDKTTVLPGVNKALKILIAEDDKISAEYLKTLLEAIDGKLITSANGAEAVEHCRKNPDIDLVLMDVQMPQMNGYESTRKIREFNRDVIIIAQTAYALEGDDKEALQAGCNEHLPKPVSRELLMSLIWKYFPSVKMNLN